MEAVLTPDVDCVLLPQPDSRVGVGPELAQMGDVQQVNACASQSQLDQMVDFSRFLVHSSVPRVKPSVELSRRSTPIPKV